LDHQTVVGLFGFLELQLQVFAVVVEVADVVGTVVVEETWKVR
jgi:hypothetical protein